MNGHEDLLRDVIPVVEARLTEDQRRELRQKVLAYRPKSGPSGDDAGRNIDAVNDTPVS